MSGAGCTARLLACAAVAVALAALIAVFAFAEWL